MDGIKIKIHSKDKIAKLFGNLDKNIKIIENEFDCLIRIKSGNIIIQGSDKEIVEILILKLLEEIEHNKKIDDQLIDFYINKVKQNELSKLDTMNDFIICLNVKGQAIKPKTPGQKSYVEGIKNNVLTFGIGPAGTGKTYLAVAMAVRAFRNKEIDRIIITRPAVEAGENLGFLPGDLEMKIDPYLRPLHDALYNLLGSKLFNKYKENGLIEVAPLAYMRGRTLDNAFIILDEAQNTTIAQMKMFLTRFGFGSKVVVNGDISQIDLKGHKSSGLVHASKILKDIKNINISRLKGEDVVRHRLVKDIISRYEKGGK